MWSFHLKGANNQYELIRNGESSDRPESRGSWRLAKRRSLYMSVAVICLFFASLTLFLVDIFSLRQPAVTDLGGIKNLEGGGYAWFLKHLWPVGRPDRIDNWENENSKTMHALFTCTAARNCSQNQTSVVILSSPHFADSIAGHVSGEDIWAISIILALQDLGYTAIYAPRNYELSRIYRQFPHLVKAILIEGSDAHKCFESSKCIKSKSHPLGIPVWKMFSLHFWTGADHPLGSPWTLSPENFPLLNPANCAENFYLGYSIERTCLAMPVTPPEERPMQAYILSKQTSYLYNDNFAWKGMSFKPPFPLEIISGMRNNTEFPSTIPPGWNNLGQLDKDAFYHHLERSRVLIGIGTPTLSPSPYDALCRGVPFINPILNWKGEDPDNRDEWQTQHDGLKYENPPYVYNVRRGDEEGFWAAIKSAIDNPIPRYIVPNMTMEALKYRVGRLVEGDWKSKAELILAERKVSGKGKLFDL